MAYKPACQIFFILPRRVVCASVRSDASMAALVRAAAARRGRSEGWDMGKGGARGRGRPANEIRSQEEGSSSSWVIRMLSSILGLQSVDQGNLHSKKGGVATK